MPGRANGTTKRIGAARRLAVLVVGGLAALAPGIHGARAAVVDMRIGAVTYDGRFDSDVHTRIWQTPFEIVLNRATSKLTVSIPYVGIDHVGNVTWTADGPLILGTGGAGRPSYQTISAGASRRGLGDILISDEIYLVRPGKGARPLIGLVFDYKWATADRKEGLGTGEADWSGGLDYLQPLGKVVQLRASGAYRSMGDPSGIDFKNGIKYSGGIAFVTKGAAWRLQYDMVPAYLDKAPVFDTFGIPTGIAPVQDRKSLRIDYVKRARSGGTIRLGVTHGLNSSSEDLGLMLILSSGEQ